MKRVIPTAAAAVTIGLAAACAPPAQVAPGIPARPPCAAPVTRIFETNKVPCIPTPPQRLDVVPAMANQNDPIEASAAGVRCGTWGGAIEWQIVNGIQVRVCRTVDPNLYGVW